MTIENRLKKVISSWFLSEPLLYAVICTHAVVKNDALTIPMRTGSGRIEYSELLLSKYSDLQLAEYLKIEAFRILLGHPYQRQPYKAKKGILLLASDITIDQMYKSPDEAKITLAGVDYCKNQAVRFATLIHPLGIKWDNSEELKFFQRNFQIEQKNGNLVFQDSLTYEQWYNKLHFLINETAIAGSENSGSTTDTEKFFSGVDEAAELWEENEDISELIKQKIEDAQNEQGWGGLGGTEIRKIKDQCDFSFDYRRALTQFRANIISANRTLTRMKPSRRYGFKAMGSRYNRKADILIAVDVSGSITEESFEHFYHAIKNFFFLGIIEKIDLIFFDVNVKNTTPITFSKKINLEEIKGRGGTNFQPALDFYAEKKDRYNGLIIFTDGQGPIPVVTGAKNQNVLWIQEGRIAYENCRQWIEQLPGHKATYLPF